MDAKILDVINSAIGELNNVEERVAGKIEKLSSIGNIAPSLGSIPSGIGGNIISSIEKASAGKIDSLIAGIGGGSSGKIMSAISTAQAGDVKKSILNFAAGDNRVLNKIVGDISSYGGIVEGKISAARSLQSGANNILMKTYESLVGGIFNSPNNLVFLSKLSMEDTGKKYSKRDALLGELLGWNSFAQNQIEKLTESFYAITNTEKLSNASINLEKAKLSLNIVDTALNAPIPTFFSSKYESAISSYDEALRNMQDVHEFNDSLYSEAVNQISSLMDAISNITKDLKKRIDNLKNFFKNFKDNFFDFGVDKDLIRILINETKQIKKDVNDLLKNPISIEPSKKYSIISKIFYIKIRLIYAKENIKNSVILVESMDSSNPLRLEFNKFENMLGDLGGHDENPLEILSLVKNSKNYLNTSFSKLIKQPNFNPSKLLGIFNNKIPDLISGQKAKSVVFLGALKKFNPRENIAVQKALSNIQTIGGTDGVKKIISGDWGGFFEDLKGGNLAKNVLSKKVQDVLSSGNLPSGLRVALSKSVSMSNYFSPMVDDSFADRDKIVDKAKNDLKKQRESCNMIKNSLKNFL